MQEDVLWELLQVMHLVDLLPTPAQAISLEENEQNSHLDGGGNPLASLA